jgi:hypothetical protein
MNRIPLSGKNGAGKFVIVDDDTAEQLDGVRIWDDGRGYAYIRNGDTKQHLHRFIMQPASKNILIDHINQDKLDNRRCNLRFCDRGQNLMNKGKLARNKSGYKGVVRNTKVKKESWSAYIKAGSIRKNLGSFPTKELAAEAYNQAAKFYHGEFAHLNDVKRGQSL